LSVGRLHSMQPGFDVCQFLHARRWASAVLVIALCPSVRLSVRPSHAGMASKRLDWSSSFWRTGCRRLILLCFAGNSGSFKNKDTSFWNFVWNSGLRKNFATACTATVTSVVNLCDAQYIINWRRSSVASLSHWASVQHDGRNAAHGQGLSAAAETCCWDWASRGLAAIAEQFGHCSLVC